MAFRKRDLIGSVSGIAMLIGAAPAFAADAPPSSTTQVGEVTVTGIRQSLEKAIAIKRASDDQVDAISATDIGKLPDKNIADALQRLPGVNTQSAASGEGGFDENDRVSIRGTSPSLTQVNIDGHNVSTGDWFILDQYQTVGRSVSFDLLPSEVVQEVSVYKTQDASLLEGGVAGVVDIQTRNPLSLGKDYTIEGSLQGQYETLSKETKPQFNGLIGWHNDEKTFGVIVQGFAEDRSAERFGQETLSYTPIAQATFNSAGVLTGGDPVTIAHPNLVGVMAPALIGSSLFKQEKQRDGGYADIEFSPNDKIDLNLSGFYAKLNATNFNDNYMYWGTHELANNVPTSYTVQNNTLVGAVWPGTQVALPAGMYYNSAHTLGPVDGLVIDNIDRPDENSTSYYINLDGKWNPTSFLTLKGQVGFTEGTGNTPESPSFESDGASAGISYGQSGNGWLVSPVAGNGYTGPQSSAGLANDWAWNDVFNEVDKETYGKIDAKWDLGDGLFKNVEFGARMSDHVRQVDGWDRGCTLGANGACWNSPTDPFSVINPTSYPGGFSAGALGIPGLVIPLGAQPGNVAAVINAINDGVHGPPSSLVQPQNYYFMGSFKVHEVDTEGYVMTHLGGDNWRANAGVRIADTKETPNANVTAPSPSQDTGPAITTSAYGNYYVTHKTYDYLDVLPSVNFTYDIQKNLLLRLSAAETMSRPDYSALGGTVTLTDLTLTGNGGDTALKPVKAAVYDAALDFYYGPTSLASISVFHDDLQSYITYSNHTAIYDDQQEGCENVTTCHPIVPPPPETYTISSPSNTTGELTGVELQVQQPIAYGFGFQANGTIIDGHEASGAPLVGTSKITYNLVGYYENYGFSARLAYTFRSHFYVGLDRSSAENQADYGTLDGSLSYQVNPNITLTFDALNMTNSILKYYAANTTQVRAVYENGSQYYAGVKFKF
jgi:iron complex outermembrane receptor protein